MAYIDGAVSAVPAQNREKYIEHSRKFAAFAKSEGALECLECWENDVPDGEVTSFPMAVKKAAGEAVVLSVIKWPSKEARDKAWQKMMSDETIMGGMGEMPFDGKRMIFGGFDVIMQS